MNIEKFSKARKRLFQGRPFSNPDELQNLYDELFEAAAPEHVGNNIGIDISDQIGCFCGWKSKGYWDGAEYAWADWYEHVANEMGLIPQKCPCGKTYVPAEGGTPCHELRPTK